MNNGNAIEISQQTVQAVVDVLKAGPSGIYVPGSGIVQKDVTQATGLVAYNLEAPSKLLVPVMSPLRNRIVRKNDGTGTAAEWKTITSLDTARTDIFTAEGTKAATVNVTVNPVTAGYRTISKGDNNSFQSQWAGKGFEDVKARNILRLLAHVMIMEEQALLGADTTLAAPTAPTLTAGTGTVAAATVSVIVRAVTNIGRGRKSANSTIVVAGNDDSIRATTPYVDGAVAYQWFMGPAGTERLEATTTINSVEVTSLAGTGALASATADTHTDALAFQGLIRQITTGGVVRTLATGTPGVGTALALSDIDSLLQSQWDTWRANPDMIVVNSQESMKLTNLVLAANGGPTLFMTNDASQLGNLTGGYRLTSYLNKVTGKAIPVLTHPYLRQGNLLTLSFDMPFPGADIDNVIEVQTRQEYMQIDYPLTSPKWEYEVLVDEVLKLYFPGACGMIRNINTL